jgi:flagellar assembly factor FliW
MVSPYFGEIHWEPGCELTFPAGLPGFERHRRSIPIEIPAQRPLLYLQSADAAEICLLALPALAVRADFRLNLSEDDRLLLGIEPDNEVPVAGIDVICLALLVPFS